MIQNLIKGTTQNNKSSEEPEKAQPVEHADRNFE